MISYLLLLISQLQISLEGSVNPTCTVPFNLFLFEKLFNYNTLML